MNFFLHINKKLVFIVGLTIILLFTIFIFFKQININNIDLSISIRNSSNADVSKPKFTINNETKKIYITANQGNFLNKDEILLEDNVRFKSNEFSLETEKVIFNRNKQTAVSKTKSLFKSKNTIISSDGFDIYDNGNKITFYGKSLITLK